MSETLDKLYLEYSEITSAKTRKEIQLEYEVKRLKKLLEAEQLLVKEIKAAFRHVSGIPTHIKQFKTKIDEHFKQGGSADTYRGEEARRRELEGFGRPINPNAIVSNPTRTGF